MQLKIRKNKYLTFAGFLLATCFFSCSETEHTEDVTAEITAAQIEGRKAARNIIMKEWKDTAQLQKALLEAKACQSRYLIEGNKHQADAFDSAFISTIRTINPDLATKIKTKRQ